MNIAIITGASSGMGKEFARQLTEKVLGLDEVWLIARRSERLASLAKDDTFPFFKINVTPIERNHFAHTHTG